MKQHKNNKTYNTLVRQKRRRGSSTKEDDDDDEDEDDVKVDDWQRRYFTPRFLNH